MIDFTEKTYAALRKQMLESVPDIYDKRDTAPIPTALSPAAYVFEGFYLSLDLVQRQAFVQTAVGASLDLLAPLGGISRYPASPAVRLGVFNTPVPLGSRFSTINGAESINFVVTAQEDAPNQYQLTAETAGAIGNEYSGPILPITSVQGLTSAQITDILIPGDDTETDEALRARLVTALTEKPFGGNIASYRAAILEIDGVGGVQVYPTWSGGGTVKCSVLGADLLPASPELVERIQTAIDPQRTGAGLGIAPIGAQVTISAPEKVEVSVSAVVTLAAGYDLEQVQPLVEASIEVYLRSVRQAWDTQLGSGTVEYAADVYLSRVLAAIVGTTGVVNAVSVQLNGGSEDLILTETGALQQVPTLGTVTLRE